MHQKDQVSKTDVPSFLDVLYMTVWPSEGFDLEKCRLFNKTHWTLGIYTAIVYILVAHILQIVLRHRRKPFSLKFPLKIWNSLMAIHSICALYQVAPVFFNIISEPNGFHNSVCRRYEKLDLRLRRIHVAFYIHNHNLVYFCFKDFIFGYILVLGMVVLTRTVSGARRHTIYCTTEATPAFLSLVSTVILELP